MAKKHPKALPYLFLSEMWERFGFYLMLGIFFLYMTDTQRGGLGMDRKEARREANLRTKIQNERRSSKSREPNSYR